VLGAAQGLKERYERHHQCVYEPGALEAAVALSARYVADRFLPDKVRMPYTTFRLFRGIGYLIPY
jgi:ATP-dependent Clp protease ATP-binding subunit ClpA